ncbi:MAG: beta-ketoacyl synthase chain length factor [Synergistaceae bacterium]|nr:beta-ketoacyl synthase chain length factor [Synergistaceae bacterium]
MGTGGTNPKELFETFEQRLRPFKAIEGFDTSFFTCKSVIACKEPDYKRLVPLKFLKRTDEITKLTMASGKQALDSARIIISKQNTERIGVIYGTGAGPVETLEAINRDATVHGISAVNPASFPNSVLNQAAGNFCIANMLKGPSSTVTGSLASLMQAFFYACELLKNGHADSCVVIASDECNEPLLLGYNKVGLLSSNNLPPLAEGADGMLFSKSSTAFVLEKESAAKSRNAEILASVLSTKCCSDNSELKHVDPEGIELRYCVNEAIKQAGIERTDLYVSSACGIAEFDRAEKALIASLPKETRVSCPQAMLGTPLGASGGYGILNALYSFSSGKVTGMPEGDYTLSQEIALHIKKAENEAADVKTACISSAGFGGTYVSIVLGKGAYDN